MILIISNEMDISTDEVCQWLYLKKANYFRINSQDRIFIKNIKIEDNKKVDFTIAIKDKGNIKFSEITTYWYRRGSLRPHYGYYHHLDSKDKIINQYQDFLKQDAKSYEYFFHHFLRVYKKGIGFYYDNDTNKLFNLCVAKEVGLNIPKTNISQYKKDTVEFIKKTGNTIVKTNDTPFVLEKNSISYTFPTTTITLDNVSKLKNELFLPSIVQNNINKLFELRIFYFNETLFSSAIFSQQNPQTITDFRKYDFKKPNRVIPYILPEIIKNKLILFMKKINMITGSIDMIYTKEHKYIFLEVNPVGQFQQVSLPCNYYIEKYIAEYLIKLNNEQHRKKAK